MTMSAAPKTDPIVAPTMAPVDIEVDRITSALREDSDAAIFIVSSLTIARCFERKQSAEIDASK